MHINSLIKKTNHFYSIAISLAERAKATNKTAFTYKMNNMDIISLYDNIKNQVTAMAEIEPWRLPSNIGRPFKQLVGLASANPFDSILMMGLVWKHFGPVTPDISSVSNMAVTFIENYFNKHKNNENLIRSRSPNLLASEDDALDCIYLPNPDYIGLVGNIQIQDIDNDKKLKGIIYSPTKELLSDLMKNPPR